MRDLFSSFAISISCGAIAAWIGADERVFDTFGIAARVLQGIFIGGAVIGVLSMIARIREAMR